MATSLITCQWCDTTEAQESIECQCGDTLGLHSVVCPHGTASCNGFKPAEQLSNKPGLIKFFKVGKLYSESECIYCKNGGTLAGTGFDYYDQWCGCGQNFGGHLYKHPHLPCDGNEKCGGFISDGLGSHKDAKPSVEPSPETETEENHLCFLSELKPKTVPQSVLDLMPGSTPEDWKPGPTGSSGYIPGWVHKNCKLGKGSIVLQNAVVYGNAKIGKETSIHGNARVSGTVGNNSSVYGSAEVHGTIGDFCVISGDCIIEEGVTIGNHKVLSKTPVIPTTQKARGISALKDHKLDVPAFDIYKIEKLKTEAQLKKLEGRFVRPCPKNPRHGFVDSRPIATIDEAKALIKETKAADSEAEILAMPHIQASHSAIWCPGQMTVGSGNDGATTGRDCLIVPVVGKPAQDTVKDWAQLLKDAGITEAPYLELLWTKKRPTKYSPKNNGYIPDRSKPSEYEIKYVQLRNGPEVPDSLDFIPSELKVTKVVEAEGDLLEWEKKVKTFKPGTVVWHPRGSLASHYAVHCFLSKIPVLTTKKPLVGKTLIPSVDTPKPNLEQIRKGFLVGCKARISIHQACYLMFAGCHSTTKWLGRVDSLLGLSMGCTYRLLITAMLGEYRHKGGSKDHGKNREAVYKNRWNHTVRKPVLELYEEAMASFDQDKSEWGQGSGYGGPKWFILSRYAGLMFNYLVDGDIEKAIDALNKGVNSVHNGGWTFNKFISQSEMNKSSENPIYACLKVGPILYDTSVSKLVASALAKHFKPDRKFKTIDPTLDVEKYLKDRCSYSSGSSSSYSKPANTKKLCCDNPNCCGNPECEECHPEEQMVGYTCPLCQDKGCSECPLTYTTCSHVEGHMGNHSGKETMIFLTIEKSASSKPIATMACEKHLPYYLGDGWKIIDTKGEKL